MAVRGQSWGSPSWCVLHLIQLGETTDLGNASQRTQVGMRSDASCTCVSKLHCFTVEVVGTQMRKISVKPGSAFANWLDSIIYLSGLLPRQNKQKSWQECSEASHLTQKDKRATWLVTIFLTTVYAHKPNASLWQLRFSLLLPVFINEITVTVVNSKHKWTSNQNGLTQDILADGLLSMMSLRIKHMRTPLTFSLTLRSKNFLVVAFTDLIRATKLQRHCPSPNSHT